MATTKRDSMDASTSAADLSTKLKATSVSDPPLPISAPTPRLLALPTKILNRILTHLLDTEIVAAALPNISYTPTLQANGVLAFKTSRPAFPVHMSLFRVCKSLSEKARLYFYSQNLFVRFEIRSPDARAAKTMLLDSGLLFCAPAPAAVENMNGHAVDLLLVEKQSVQKRAVVLFPAQYLPRLIKFWSDATKANKSWPGRHCLDMRMREGYGFEPARLSGDLMEPFRFLSGFSSVKIDGECLLDGYAEGLQKHLTASEFTAAAWLATIEDMVQRGEKERASKNDEVARQHYTCAVIALTYGYLTHPEDLHSQAESFARAIQRARWRCEFGIGRSFLSQYHMDEPATPTTPSPLDWRADAKLAKALLTSEAALSSALSLATNSPSPTSNPWLMTLPVDLVPPNAETWYDDSERGECWYALGLAHMALEEFLFAAGDLERAAGMVASQIKGEVDSVFACVRDRIDWEVAPGSGLKAAAAVANTVK